MIKVNNLSLPLNYGEEDLKAAAAKKLKADPAAIKSLTVLKKSLDARKKSDIHYIFSVALDISDPRKYLKNKAAESYMPSAPAAVPRSRLKERPVIVGFGPAGMFAALILAQSGARPIVLERGQDADTRKKQTELFWQKGILDENSNVQFGEGGAGAFSDGKLNTGTHSPLIERVLKTLAENGAPEEILYQAKPHIGTDRLIPTVKNIRKKIGDLGGEVIFGARFTDFTVKNGALSSIVYEREGAAAELPAENLILAAGHSARDTFKLLFDKGVVMESKAFSVGMRIEHLQRELNRSMYGENAELSLLPPADYRLAVHLPSGRGVYSFCMCPGGYVTPSASEKNSVVTNGMSYYSRSGENANSAILVGVDPSDFPDPTPLAGVAFQRKIEQAAFKAAGGNYAAPCTTAGMLLGKTGKFEIGSVKPTYLPSVSYADPREYLPAFAVDSIAQALPLFAQRISCFSDNEAILTGPETRSSSPVRITRGSDLQSLSVKGLYPCGEGAGYAGGIVSSAVDGIKCALALLEI
ncbi:MAG: hypothetical protein NC228_00770 [[Eubacterium] siraeum]|nr:hypothetical protein [[Eubacterium] siraeum]